MSDEAAMIDDDNPEWTAEDFGRSMPPDRLPAHVIAAFPKTNTGGRPRGSSKEQVALRIDKDVLTRFRQDGPGWQTRMNTLLRLASGLDQTPSIGRSILAQEDGARLDQLAA